MVVTIVDLWMFLFEIEENGRIGTDGDMTEIASISHTPFHSSTSITNPTSGCSAAYTELCLAHPKTIPIAMK
jgi:hypothetical protein